MSEDTRLNEWFVPKFGPPKFRVFVGLMFLPYTGMCVSFTILGSMVASVIAWDRVAALSLIYGLALGLSAHAADNLGSKKKPWGKHFSSKDLWLIMFLALIAAYSIASYYIIYRVPNLLIVAILEGFFVFAYNLEIFKGTLHNNLCFIFSWGILPVLAGYIMQTNTIGILPIMLSALAGIISYVHIRISREYKELKRHAIEPRCKKLEVYLKLISFGTIAVGLISVWIRASAEPNFNLRLI